MVGDSFVILLSSQRLQHRPQGFGFGPCQHAVRDVMPRSGCGARASTRGGATGTALTRCVTRKNRHEAPHWHLPLAKAGVACQHFRPCSLMLVESLHVCCRPQHFGHCILLPQSWLAMAVLAECARRPRTARHARQQLRPRSFNLNLVSEPILIHPVGFILNLGPEPILIYLIEFNLIFRSDPS